MQKVGAVAITSYPTLIVSSPKILAAEDILCGPGCPHEVETRLIDGKLLKVYKNLAPTLRDFWVSAVEKNGDKTYIVFGSEWLTYRQVFNRSVRTAGILYTVYGIRKGNHIFKQFTLPRI